MSNENFFKASNGYEIRSNFGYFDDHEECYEVRDNEAYLLKRLGQGSLQALREFFQHERDQQLGRVRWPKNTDYVIYRDESEDTIGEGRAVFVLDEATGIFGIFREGTVNEPVYELGHAAHWYFTEGPGKPDRPWEDAKEGEVWRLTVDVEDGTFLVKENLAGTLYFFGTAFSIGADHSDITAGRKLLNADGSVADE